MGAFWGLYENLTEVLPQISRQIGGSPKNRSEIRVVPDVVKYDYPAEHSSAPTYEDDSARGKRSIEKKLERLQDKIDRKFDQAYEKLIKKEKDSAPWTTETEQPWSKTKEPEQPWTVPVETERVCEEVPQTKCSVVPREECHRGARRVQGR